MSRRSKNFSKLSNKQILPQHNLKKLFTVLLTAHTINDAKLPLDMTVIADENDENIPRMMRKRNQSCHEPIMRCKPLVPINENISMGINDSIKVILAPRTLDDSVEIVEEDDKFMSPNSNEAATTVPFKKRRFTICSDEAPEGFSKSHGKSGGKPKRTEVEMLIESAKSLHMWLGEVEGRTRRIKRRAISPPAPQTPKKKAAKKTPASPTPKKTAPVTPKKKQKTLNTPLRKDQALNMSVEQPSAVEDFSSKYLYVKHPYKLTKHPCGSSDITFQRFVPGTGMVHMKPHSAREWNHSGQYSLVSLIDSRFAIKN